MQSEIRVKTETLDLVSLEKKTPSLIKIDLGVHEVEVFEDSSYTLTDAESLLIIQYFPPKQCAVLSLLHK